jgi:hypothetical protein
LALSPTSSHGGGFPGTWAFDPETDVLTITPQPLFTPIRIEQQSGANTLLAAGEVSTQGSGDVTAAAFHASEISVDAPGNVLFGEAQAGLAGTPSQLGSIKMTDPSSPGETVWGYGRMSYITSSFDPPAGQAVWRVTHGSGSYTGDIARFGTMRVTASSAPVVAVNAAPADAELAAGECAMWFDDTNGAAKVMFKAKQADGTVRTGSVVLS